MYLKQKVIVLFDWFKIINHQSRCISSQCTRSLLHLGAVTVNMQVLNLERKLEKSCTDSGRKCKIKQAERPSAHPAVLNLGLSCSEAPCHLNG